MLNFFGFLLKASLFAAAVLIAGQLVHFNGHSVSDHVKIYVTHAETGKSFSNLRHSATGLVDSVNSTVPFTEQSTHIVTGAASESHTENAREPAAANGQTDMAGRVKEIRAQERAALDNVIEKQ